MVAFRLLRTLMPFVSLVLVISIASSLQNPTPMKVSVNTKPMVFHVDGKQVFKKRAYLCAGPSHYMGQEQRCIAEELLPSSFFGMISPVGFAMTLLSFALVFCIAVLDAVIRSPSTASIRLRSVQGETSVSNRAPMLDSRSMVLYQAPESFSFYPMEMFILYRALCVVFWAANSIQANVKPLAIEPESPVLPATPDILLYRAISMMVQVYTMQQNALRHYGIGSPCATTSSPKLLTIEQSPLKVHLSSPSLFSNASDYGPMRPPLPTTNPAAGMLTNLVVAYWQQRMVSVRLPSVVSMSISRGTETKVSMIPTPATSFGRMGTVVVSKVPRTPAVAAEQSAVAGIGVRNHVLVVVDDDDDDDTLESQERPMSSLARAVVEASSKRIEVVDQPSRQPGHSTSCERPISSLARAVEEESKRNKLTDLTRQAGLGSFYERSTSSLARAVEESKRNKVANQSRQSGCGSSCEGPKSSLARAVQESKRNKTVNRSRQPGRGSSCEGPKSSLARAVEQSQRNKKADRSQKQGRAPSSPACGAKKAIKQTDQVSKGGPKNAASQGSGQRHRKSTNRKSVAPKHAGTSQQCRRHRKNAGPSPQQAKQEASTAEAPTGLGDQQQPPLTKRQRRNARQRENKRRGMLEKKLAAE